MTGAPIMVVLSSGALGGAEAGVEVGQDVLERLEADGQADQVGGDAGGGLLGLGQLRVGGRRRVDGQAADVADVGQVAEQLEPLDEAPARLLAALDAEGEDRAATSREVAAAGARARGSRRGRGRSPTRPRRGPRASWPPRGRWPRGAPCAG